MTLTRALERAARQLADQQSDRVAELPTGQDLILTVTGAAPLLVSWRGADVAVDRRLEGNAINLGDRVLCRVVDDQLILLGKLV